MKMQTIYKCKTSRKKEIILPGVRRPELGNAEASPDEGSKVVTLSPPKFCDKTESGKGVNLNYRTKNLFII